jgi:hypothetical protein
MAAPTTAPASAVLRYLGDVLPLPWRISGTLPRFSGLHTGSSRYTPVGESNPAKVCRLVPLRGETTRRCSPGLSEMGAPPGPAGGTRPEALSVSKRAWPCDAARDQMRASETATLRTADHKTAELALSLAGEFAGLFPKILKREAG